MYSKDANYHKELRYKMNKKGMGKYCCHPDYEKAGGNEYISKWICITCKSILYKKEIK